MFRLGSCLDQMGGIIALALVPWDYSSKFMSLGSRRAWPEPYRSDGSTVDAAFALLSHDAIMGRGVGASTASIGPVVNQPATQPVASADVWTGV